MNTPATHPWITSLQAGLDGLERALLEADPDSVERCSAHIQAVLKQAPKTAEFGVAGSRLRHDMLQAAHRFGQLRQTVLRASAQNRRSLNTLLPSQAAQPTYGRQPGATGSTGGAGHGYLSA